MSLSSALLPFLLVGLTGWPADLPFDREVEVERRFPGPIWLRLCGVLLSLTTLFLGGLGSRSLSGLADLSLRGSAAWRLPERRCLRLSVADEVDVLKMLACLLVRGGDG